MYCAPISTTTLLKNKSAYKRSISNISSRLYSSESDNKQPEPTNFKDKVSAMWKNYGKIAIGTYLSIYVTTLGSLFFALDFNVFNSATVGLDPQMAIDKV